MKTGEDQVIQKIAKALAFKDPGGPTRRAGLVLGAGDDAALVVPRPGYQAILTCDWFLEGSHFLRDKHRPIQSAGSAWPSGKRRSRDGRPAKAFLLSLALPGTHTGKWLNGFLSGLARAERRLGCQLAGGDTTKSDNILINVTVVGEIRLGRAVLRSGSKPGDLIFVSGAPRGGGAGPAMAAARPSRSPPRECLHQEASLPGAAISSWAMVG